MSDLDKLIEAVEAGTISTDLIMDAFGNGWDDIIVLAAFDGSLDAAKRLHEALLPGWDYRLGRDGSVFYALVFVSGRMNEHMVDWQLCPVSTARAWLLAILKAVRAQAAP